MQHGRYEEALKELEKDEEIAKLLLKDPKNEFYQSNLQKSFDDVFTLGYLLCDMGRFLQAQSFCELSLLISQKLLENAPDNVSYQSSVAATLNNLGTLLSNMGRIEESKQRYENALEICEKLLATGPDNVSYQSDVAMTLNNLGTLLSDMGRIEESKQRCENALEIYETLLRNDPDNVSYQSDVAMTLNNLGTLLSNMGRIEESKQRYENALEICEKLLATDPDNVSYQSSVAMTLNNLGTLLWNMGRIEESKQRYENALEIRQKLLAIDPDNVSYQSDVAMTLNNLENLLKNMGRIEEAKQRYENVLEIYEKLLDTDPDNVVYQSDVAMALNNLGTLLSDMGRIEESKQRYENALEMRQTLLATDPDNVSYQSSVAMTLNNLGTLLWNMGRIEESKQRYENALEIYETLLRNDPDNVSYQSDVAMTLNNLGNLLKNMGRIEEAKQRYENALEMRQTLLATDPDNVSYQSDVAMTLNNLGNLLINMGRREEAKQRYENALEIYEKLLENDLSNVSYQSYVAMTLNNLGNLSYLERNYSIALEIISGARKYALGSANLDLLSKIYWSLGRCYEKLIDNDSAFTNYKESIECIESIRSQCLIEEIKMDIMWDKSTLYSDMISFLCTRMNDPEEAWGYLGRVKSRTLLDSLRYLELETPANVPEELLVNEKQLLESIRSLDRLIRKTEKANEIAQLTRKVKETEAELNGVYDQIRDFSPEYVDLRKGQPLGIKEIKELIGSQTKKIAFVEYYTTSDKVFMFVMRSDEKVPKVEIVDLTRKSLLIHIQNYFSEIITMRGRIGEMWTNLSKYLIEPVFGYIKDCELTYLVPHGLLHYLPLHALFAENKRLIEYFPIVYSPSLTALKYSQNKPARKLESCLSIGYTPNENEKEIFEGEAKLVAKLFNVEPKLGTEATSNILKNASNDVIHISCHGGFDWENSLNSGLRLADKDLKMKEIFDLNLSTNLLVLSACETGLNGQKPGDELIGLTRAFLYAGVGSLIVSLWSVRADSTFEFMEKFYRKIREEKMTKAEALQMTQVEFIHDERYSNPYLWAPFVLIGDWK
ncbi:tetratricopeptide repeat protein [Methanosarcina sp. DH1]|uniref:CHAT domain-containing protein n=1 Tax=Methanosarcina sp. DH1 TaxID=2605695 RepID=UPI001E33A0D7|nr:tetratricopeptide repeat protein [Methanosarcina sp. DH1]